MWSRLTRAFIVLLLCFHEDASASPLDSASGVLTSRGTGDLCGAANVRTVIVGGRLFFSAGYYSFVGGDTLALVPELFYVDLQESFPAGGFLLKSNFSSISLPSGLNYTDENAMLFNDNTTIYFYDPDVPSGTGEMWTYNVSTNTFTDISIQGASNASTTQLPTFYGGWASNPATGESYYTGTPLGYDGGTVATPSLQRFDSSTSSDIHWLANVHDGPLLQGGELVYARAGAEGVLIAFGGYNYTQDYVDSSGFSMAEIWVFDIASSTWFTVNATGDIPPPTALFCSGVSSAPDDSSFQITIFAGYDLTEHETKNSVYVLTLPAFVWINVTSSDDDSPGRRNHACSVWNEAQLISLGGWVDNTTDSYTQDGCNDLASSLVVLDLTTFTFKTEFEPDQIYAQPQAVYDAIGGFAQGGALQSSPSGGFNDSRLDTIFSQRVARVTQPTSFPSTPNSTSPETTKPLITKPTFANPAPTNSLSGGKSHTGAIVGGVIGGIAGILAVLGLGAFCLKRYRKREDMPLHEPISTSYYNKQEPSAQAASVIADSRQQCSEVEGSSAYHELATTEPSYELQNENRHNIGIGR